MIKVEDKVEYLPESGAAVDPNAIINNAMREIIQTLQGKMNELESEGHKAVVQVTGIPNQKIHYIVEGDTQEFADYVRDELMKIKF